MRVRFAPSPTGPAARRQRAHGALQLAARARPRRHVHPAHRGHRRRAIDQGVGGRASSRICAGSDSSGTRGRTSAAPCGPYRQSERLHLYTSYANELLAAGHAYYCFCSPQKLEDDAQAHARGGQAAAVRRHLPIDLSPRRRSAASTPASAPSSASACPSTSTSSFQDLVRGEVTFSTDVIGDPVLVRSDGRPAYNFAVVIDDALMEMTHVIRGEDHISNTPRQVLLYQRARVRAAAVRAPLAGAGSRSHAALEAPRRDVGLGVPRARLSARGADQLPGADRLVAAYRRRQRRTSEELMPMDELARRFALEDVGHSAGVFDLEKLAWMNRHYMKAAAPGRLAAESRALLPRARLPRAADRRRAGLHRVAAADGGGLRRSPRGDSRSPRVPVRLRRRRPRSSARRSPRSCTSPARAT